jgi:YD repeat-containing protein
MNASDAVQSYHIVFKAVNMTSRTVHEVTLEEYRLNRTIQFTYDDLNRLTQETWIGTSQQINYSYDTVGNLRTIADLYSSLTFSYDNQNRSTSIDNSGTPNFPTVVLGQTYDANSNRLRLTDTIAGQLRGTEAGHVLDVLFSV